VNEELEDELERLRLRRDVNGYLDELDIRSPAIRSEMLDEPERALRILDTASSAPRIRNRAAFAIARWRDRDRRSAEPAVLEITEDEELVPPTLDVLELQWSQEPSFVGGLVLKLMAAAIARAGGFEELRASFDERRVSY